MRRINRRGFIKGARTACAFILIAILFSCPLPAPSQSSADPDTVRSQLLKGIEIDYSGDFDTALKIFEGIGKTSPGHPAPDFFQVSVLFGKNSIDASNPRYNDQISVLLTNCVAKSETRLESNPGDLEALHYIGLCYTYLGRLEAHQGHIYQGGVHGETGRDYLERALAICENNSGEADFDSKVCEDIHFPFGAYAYFAGRLPGFLQAMNFLWFIPRGTTEEGLSALERAKANSGLHTLDATNLLINIYSIFEDGQAQKALELSNYMSTKYPDNPGIDLVHAEALNLNGLHGEAIARANSIIEKVSGGMRNYDKVANLGALMVIAEADLAEGRLDAAEKKLLVLKADPGYQNNTLTPRIPLALGMVYDLQERRGKAIVMYEKVSTYEGATWNRQAQKKAEAYLDQPYKQQ